MEDKEQIRTVLKELTPEQYEFIMNSFNKMNSEVLEYKPGKFLGCHLTNPPFSVTVTVKTEYWFLGVA